MATTATELGQFGDAPANNPASIPSVVNREYLKRADACLERVVEWLETFDPDEVDFVTADGVVTIEFSDGVRYVLNRQSAADQMWFAAGVRAWHYDFSDDGSWLSDKDGHELYDGLGRAISEKIGRTVSVPN